MRISNEDKEQLIRRLFADNRTEDDNEQFISRIRDRISRVDIQLPTIEVRYESLTVEAQAQITSRSLPTLVNVATNSIESGLSMVGMPVTEKAALSILKDVSGIIKPSRMTLLLGPPSSGKTTLLLALAGRLAKNLKVLGKVTYNGHQLTDFVPQKTSAYVSQHDLHVAVRETLESAARCQGVGDQSNLLTELASRETERGIIPDPDVDFFMKGVAMQEKSSGLVTDYILKILGLDICADTMIGNDMRKGIFGGQEKRVTTGAMIVGPITAMFMDEISTGLDSSTTFQIIKCFGDVAHILEITVVISLLQPAPETYNLFDDIILLSEGQVVYHGPRESIVAFFEACGYTCPERKGVADFLQEVTSKKDQEQYWTDKDKQYHYTTVNDFVKAYKNYRVGETMAGELAVPYDKSRSHPGDLAFEKSNLCPTVEEELTGVDGTSPSSMRRERNEIENVNVDVPVVSTIIEIASSSAICRICHSFRVNDEIVETMDLGCACKGGLSHVHKVCGEIWFQHKGSRFCEICLCQARNMPFINILQYRRDRVAALEAHLVGACFWLRWRLIALVLCWLAMGIYHYKVHIGFFSDYYGIVACVFSMYIIALPFVVNAAIICWLPTP